MSILKKAEEVAEKIKLDKKLKREIEKARSEALQKEQGNLHSAVTRLVKEVAADKRFSFKNNTLYFGSSPVASDFEVRFEPGDGKYEEGCGYSEDHYILSWVRYYQNRNYARRGNCSEESFRDEMSNLIAEFIASE